MTEPGRGTVGEEGPNPEASAPMRRIGVPEELDSPELSRLAARVGDALRLRYEELNDRTNRAIESDVADLDDPTLLEMLHASVEANISTILHMLCNEIPVDRAQAATAADEYAVRLAHHRIPGISLRRAYHFGADAALAMVFEEVRRLDVDEDIRWPLLRYLVNWMNGYIDRISQEVLETYDRERRRLGEQRSTLAASLVQRVLDGQVPERFTEHTGFRLDQNHVAALLWSSDRSDRVDTTSVLLRTVRRIEPVLDAEARLVHSLDRWSLRLWFARGSRTDPIDHDAIRRTLERGAGVRMALGRLRSGIDGFRRGHDDAQAALGVLTIGPGDRTALGAGEPAVATTAMLIDDLDRTAAWVVEVLGGLAIDDERTRELRETVRVVLDEQGNQRAAADRLMLHRNSIRYRMQQAAIARGAPIDDDRMGLELALEIAHLLGRRVLVEAD